MSESFRSLIERDASVDDMAEHLDALDPLSRVGEVRAIDGRAQRKLWELAKGRRPLTLTGFVGAAEATAIYEGKNTLPVFTRFQKRFWRARTGVVAGYNHNGGFVTALVGPGYFITEDADGGELLFDYTRLPTEQPAGWPDIRANTGFVPGVVYGGMKDYVRGVSSTTVIGAAFKGGKARGQFFLLTRAPSSPKL